MFYDSGGPGATTDSGFFYQNDENYVMTICPDASGDFIQLTFTEFATQLGVDTLTIYDGDDVTAPLIGVFSGGSPADNPGVITASQTNPTGCLTIEFVSDSNFNGPGWAAEILCGTACQDITASIDSTTPAAVDGVIEILPGETVDFSGSGTFSDDSTGATYTWNFGEGGPQNGQNVSHTYNTSGVYTVTLTVADPNPTGCSDTTTVEVHVLSDFVTVDTNAYTELQLVEDVLINSGCASIANLAYQGGANSQGIAYFNKSGSDFPFQEGIILCTAPAEDAEGPATGTMAAGNWAGDADLFNYMQGLGIDPGLTSYNDAAWMEFDFIPLANEISFNFLFASDEYGGYQCQFSDAFAFFLTDLSTGVTTNLALVPGTTDPVSVITVRDNAHNPGCASVNPEFFDVYYGGTGALAATAPINFNGQTVPMTASSTVVPNNTYRIKLVVADRNDSILNSAVFLEGGSFNLGGDLGDDITIAASNTVCYGDSIVLDTEIVGADGSHIWYLGDDVIPGESNSTLTVTEPGDYTVEVVLSADCQMTDTVSVEFYPNPIIESLNNLFLCNPGAAPYIFDLTENTPLAIGSQPNAADFEVTYHNDLTEAETDVAAITTPDNYSGTDGEIIYIRIDYPGSDCYETSSFTLNITPEPTINPVGDLVQCDDPSSDGIADFDLESQSATILGAQPSSDFVVTYYDSQTSADAGTGWLSSPFASSGQPIWVRVELASDASCSNVSVGPLFNLVLNPVPEILPETQTICDNVAPGDDGFGTFDLTLSEGGILNGLIAADHAITYYEDETDAETGPGTPSEILTPTAYTNTTATTQTVYVRVENITTNCHSVTELALQVDPLPVITALSTNTDICSGADAIFTITGAPGDVVDYTVNGGATQQVTLDATTGEGVVTVAGATMDQTITLTQVTNPTTTCSSSLTDTATVTIVPLPSITSLTTNTDICSGSDAIFTITGTPDDVVDYTINGGATQQVTLDATTGEGLVTIAGAVSDQTITLELVTSPAGCSTPLTDTATITVNPNPTATVVANGDICPNGDASFTITGDAGDVVDYNINGGGSVQVTLDAAGEAIVTAAAVTVDQVLTLEQVENLGTTCLSMLTASATVVVNPLPTLVAPTPLAVCDDNIPDGITEMNLTVKNNEITGGNAGYVVTYHNDLASAQIGTPEVAPSAAAYIGTNGEVVHVRVENAATGCFDTTTLTLEVVGAPAANVPADLEYCDPDNDGLGIFDLDSTINEITGGDPTLDVTFHLTPEDAANDVLPQSSPLSNVVNQTIHVRVDYVNGATNCPTIVTLNLVVLPTPEIADPEPYELCDDDGTADGMTTFALPTMDAEILDGLNAADYEVTYYSLVSDAEIGTTAPSYIATPGAYTSGTTTLGVRVENLATGCYSTTTLDLIVNPLPVPVTTVEALSLAICDDTDANDAIATFDLSGQSGTITGGVSNWAVDYYETLADVQSDTPIADYTAYTNPMPAPMTIWVKVTNTDTGCFDLTTLTLEVDPLPTPADSADLSPIELCDDNTPGDLVETFDLTINEQAVLNGEPNVTVSYHTTFSGAASGDSSIADPTAYQNTDPAETIYVRVTNTGDPNNANDMGTGCYNITSFEIMVHPLPDATAVLEDMIACEDNTDGIYTFDLTVQDAIALNGQSATDFAVTYYETLAAAESGLGGIATPSAYANNNANPQEIFVAIRNLTTGCDVVATSFFVEVQEAANANALMPLVSCDDNMEFDGNPSNDSVMFDLTTQDATVLGAQAATDYTVTYYESEADALAGSNAIAGATSYFNTVNPQTIWVRVDNDTRPEDICYEVTSFDLQVNPVPAFVLEDTYVLCVGTNGTEVINVPVMDTGLDATLYAFEWTEAGDPATVLSTDPSYEPLIGGTYTVYVEDLATGCNSSLTTTVIESAPPAVTAEVATEAFADTHVVVATATGNSIYEFSIDHGPWVSNGTNTYTFTDVAFGEHEIMVRDANGCGVSSTTVFVMDYPLYFTPNNDGYNDTWQIAGIGNQLNAKIYIFDRYGKLLKQLSPTGAGWDGTFNGEHMPSNDYWFTVEYREPGDISGNTKEFKAHFTLKR
ncbi:choice-of-anchor L domain-containing protein [Mangrovimonas yunxiaonensis]|nr:choice-of-anchor L domain-containing protein [Mangrovimonas yunxiaonensis]